MMRAVGPEGLEITGLTARGRRQFSEQSKARLVAACFRPGVSVARMALDHELNANLLRRWIKDHLAGAAASGSGVPVPWNDTGAFVRVEAKDKQAATFAERVLPAGADAACARLSAEMPNGVRLALEGRDPQMLAAMIDALRRI